MKTNKFSLVAILALSGLMACSTITRADDTTPAPGAPPTGAPEAHKGKGGQKGGQKGGPMMAVIEKLKLSDEQKEKVMPVFKEQSEKMMALRDEAGLSMEERMAKIKAITDATKEKLKAILTPEQFTKFEEETKNLRPGGPGGHRPKKQGDNEAAPAPAAPVPGGDK